MKNFSNKIFLLFLLFFFLMLHSKTVFGQDFTVDMVSTHYIDPEIEFSQSFSSGTIEYMPELDIHSIVVPTMPYLFGFEIWSEYLDNFDLDINTNQVLRISVPQLDPNDPELDFVLGAYGGNVPDNYPTEWTYEVRFKNFLNTTVDPKSLYRAAITMGRSFGDVLISALSANWIPININGTYQSTLSIRLYVFNSTYEWLSDPVVIKGLDPKTTILDLRMEVSDNGQTLTPSYKLNNSSEWISFTAHTLPQGVGILYGMGSQVALPAVSVGIYPNDNPPPEPVQVSIDIQPKFCPNHLNTKSKGIFPVAILGTENFDVADTDIASVRLAGVAPMRSKIGDVSQPANIEYCGNFGPDYYDDLILTFRTQDIIDAIGDVDNGDEIPLTLTGMLNDGTNIFGTDTVLIIKKNKHKKNIKKTDKHKRGKKNPRFLINNFRW